MSTGTEEEQALISDDACDDKQDDVGFADYKRSDDIISRFKRRSHNGYCTLSGRVSLHDSWIPSQATEPLRSPVDSDDDDGAGDFVSYWRRADDESSCCSESEMKIHPDDDDRVETTMRPIPLSYRNPSGLVKPVMWFQQFGMASSRFRREEGPGSGTRLTSSASNFGQFGEGDHSLHASSPGEGGFGPRNKDNIFGSNRRPGILAWPSIRPFLGSRRGYTDDDDDAHSSNSMGEDKNNIHACDLPPSRDRAAVVKSISRGIVGTNDDSLLLGPTEDDVGKSITQHPPLLKRMFLTRLFQNLDVNRNASPIGRLHQYFRKEDWALATTLLQSDPQLAKTWFNIDRLYDGR